MILTTTIKKQDCIPLDPTLRPFSQESKGEEARVTVRACTRSPKDAMALVFGQTVLDTQVNQTLSITGKVAHHLLECEAFVVNQTIFLSSPSTSLLDWEGHEFQSCITHLIDMAEKQTGCTALVFMLRSQLYQHSLSTLLRAFMYLGFEMMGSYGQDPAYVLVGYEL
ncbi:hypothetical protein BY458DRAFT_513499 [Sporodiniella umbellata]|nr:hypothetical protein BY458DRAFT_513499 [Sporodiniella umbellata]